MKFPTQDAPPVERFLARINATILGVARWKFHALPGGAKN